MTDTTFASDLQVQQWSQDFFMEYVRNTRFNRYMGSDENKIIQMVMDLSRKAGDRITVQLVTRLSGNGITGDNTLMGNEESLGNYGHTININQLRNAVRRGDFEQQRGNIDILNAARVALKNWAMEKLRDDIITAMQSPNLDGTEAYSAASEAEKDAWLEANQDRVLFGALKSNLDDAGGAGGGADHSDSLLTVDSTADTLSPEIVSLAKRMAKTADPHIRPVKIGEDEEWYVLFAPSLAFRDFKTSNTTGYQEFVRDAGVRGNENPLFRDGDLVWDGVIIREIPEIPAVGNVGNGGDRVESCFLCGAQAIGVAWAEPTTAIMHTDDYTNLKGVGIKEVRGVEKLFFNDKQHGMVTVYVAAAADT